MSRRLTVNRIDLLERPIAMSATLPSFVELNPAACIKLVDGRPITLERLLQSQTYDGLLLGLQGSKREAHPP